VVLVAASEDGLGAGAAVSVFCSQAARSAAPARMQMYFFIVWNVRSNDDRSKNAFRLCDLQRLLKFKSVGLGHRPTR
jgi:hypothetical protein